MRYRMKLFSAKCLNRMLVRSWGRGLYCVSFKANEGMSLGDLLVALCQGDNNVFHQLCRYAAELY